MRAPRAMQPRTMPPETGQEEEQELPPASVAPEIGDVEDREDDAQRKGDPDEPLDRRLEEVADRSIRRSPR